MHRFILGVGKGFVVDHKDRDGLNNTRKNLRVCTSSQNSQNSGISKNNTSGYKGVGVCKMGKWKIKKYVVKIMFNRKCIHLGYFKNPVEAAKVYDKKAKELFGEFANLNFP